MNKNIVFLNIINGGQLIFKKMNKYIYKKLCKKTLFELFFIS